MTPDNYIYSTEEVELLLLTQPEVLSSEDVAKPLFAQQIFDDFGGILWFNRYFQPGRSNELNALRRRVLRIRTYTPALPHAQVLRLQRIDQCLKHFAQTPAPAFTAPHADWAAWAQEETNNARGIPLRGDWYDLLTSIYEVGISNVTIVDIVWCLAGALDSSSVRISSPVDRLYEEYLTEILEHCSV